MHEGAVFLHALELPAGACARIEELTGFAPAFFAEALLDSHLPPNAAATDFVWGR